MKVMCNSARRFRRSQGKRVCELDVAIDSRAVAFYKRLGMEIISEVRVLPLERHGVAPHYRMVKKLT
jgi:hypothetical protein